MNKMLFMLKQLLPLTYRSKYKTPDGRKRLAVWKQWFGKTFDVEHFDLAV